MPSPPTREQVESWIEAGHITKAQGKALLHTELPTPLGKTETPEAKVKDGKGFAKFLAPLQLAPAPRWRLAIPAALGAAVATTAAIGLIILDTLIATHTPTKPGDVLTWLMGLTFVVTAGLAILQTGNRREMLLAGAVMTACLFGVVHPAPSPGILIVSVLGALAILLLRLEPATRMLLAPTAVIILPTALWELLDNPVNDGTLGAFALFGAIFFLWFGVPHASGWRRIPFLFLLGFWVIIVAALAGTILGTILANGISVPNDLPADFSGGLSGTLLGLAAVAAFPVALGMLWRWPRARAFTLPTIPIPVVVLTK